MSLPGEIWREISAEAAGYEVSNFGRVRSWRSPRGRRAVPALRRQMQCKNAPHYWTVMFISTTSGKPTLRLAHQLVLTAFVGPRPKGKVARHLDGDPTNNRKSNLRWGTQAQNIADQIRHGTSTRGVQNGGAKLDRPQVLAIRSALKKGARGSTLARKYQVSQATICRIRYGHRYATVRS